MCRFECPGLAGATAIPEILAHAGQQKLVHGQLYTTMTAAYEESKPFAEKYMTLVQGYALCNTKINHALCSVLHEIAVEEVNLECFQVW